MPIFLNVKSTIENKLFYQLRSDGYLPNYSTTTPFPPRSLDDLDDTLPLLCLSERGPAASI